MLSGAKVIDAEAARAAVRATEAEKKEKREGGGDGSAAALAATATATAAAAAGTSSSSQQQQQQQQQREAWLTDPSLARQRQRAASPPPPRDASVLGGIHTERPAGLSAGAATTATTAAGAGAAPPPSAAVGDGGASWRLKALRRAQQEASTAGKNVREVVEERWGSVAELAASAVGGGQRDSSSSSSLAHLHAARDRARALGVEERLAERRAENDAAMGVEARPTRREREGRGREDDDRRRRGGRDEERSAARYGAGGGSFGGGERMHRPGEGGGSGCGCGSLSWRRRDDERRRDGGDRDRGGRDGGGGGSSRPRPRRDDEEDRERAALLSAAAPSMNAFASDGSFLKRFEGGEKQAKEEKQEEQERRATAPPPPQPAAPPAPRPSASPAPPAAPSPAPAPQPSSSEASDANRGAAAMLRARLGGGAGGSFAARPPPPPTPAAAAASGDNSSSRREEDVIHLPLVDHRGKAAPGAFGRAASSVAAAPLSNKEARKLDRFDPDGSKARYFKSDDASSSLTAAELARRTRLGDDAGVALDVDSALANAILKQGTRYKASNAANDFGADEEYDGDAGLDSLEDPRFSKRRRKFNAPSQEQRARAALVGAATREQRALDSCRWCLRSGGGGGRNDNGSSDNSNQQPPLFFVVAATERAFLAIPSVTRRLVPGQLIIAPAGHAPSEREVDEDVATDMRNFKKTAIRMHLAGFGRPTRGGGPAAATLFAEGALRPRDLRAHAVVQCFPLDAPAAGAAPAVIRQSVDDASDEWSTHHSKRLIETGRTEKGQNRTLASSVPPGFGYLRFELGLSRGWVSVVDDDADAAKRADLSRAVPMALLRLPPEAGKGRRRGGAQGAGGGGEGEEREEDRRALLEAKRAFEPFGDWVV